MGVTCGYCDQPATLVNDSNEALCRADARDHYGAEWRTETRQLTPAKVARHARTGRFERV